MAIDFTLFLVPVDSMYIEAEGLRWFQSKSGRQGAGMCNIEVVDQLCLVAANVNYPKSRDKFHSFSSSSQPMNVRLTILSCSASGQWGNSAMLIKFADQHFAEVLHTIHIYIYIFLYYERVSCIWFIIRLWVTVLSFNLLHRCGLETRPYSIHEISLCAGLKSTELSVSRAPASTGKIHPEPNFLLILHKYAKSH